VKKARKKRKKKKKKGKGETTSKITRLQFKRLQNGYDLFAEHKITLIEALLGYEFAFRHLDDRIIVVKSRPETVTSAEDTVTIEGEGMPYPKRAYQKGDLYIKLSIIMPQQKDLGTPENKVKLRSLLPKVPEPPTMVTGTEKEEYVAKVFDETAQAAKRARDQESRRMGHEEEEEGEGGVHTCRTQ